ncbi:Spy/CpxP family protein refolding chaperone [Bradyrhizobium sp.]|uniref:Spy/CpxP family protein refolding chaperone n=1 Tax=Bradyrhizobium sp. TaxID=376 RepID=UPI00261EC68C|nr:Spy/CpxP family protein refolding chaperone [Bradyrhizobium sp.]
MKTMTLAAALLLGSVSFPCWAQLPANHEAHQADQKDAPAASQPAPPTAPSGTMGQGMMGGRGMMGGGMMNMMSNVPMANMMQMMGSQQPGCGMGGMATIDHVEGRIAFLRAELKITDAQSSAWNAFADALRANAKSLGEVRASMMGQVGAAPLSLTDRLALQEKWLAARLEGIRAIRSAVTNLLASFSEDQKKAADELLAPHMGMMAMMFAMQSGQMGLGQMQSGKMMPNSR